jgi:hypothetical protein
MQNPKIKIDDSFDSTCGKGHVYDFILRQKLCSLCVARHVAIDTWKRNEVNNIQFTRNLGISLKEFACKHPYSKVCYINLNFYVNLHFN